MRPRAISDPFFSFVSLLLHFDGANGSTTFLDSSSNAISVDAVGDVSISTAQSRFGGASAYFDAAGDYAIVASDPPGLDFGTDDFTVEFWMRPDTTSGTKVICSHWNNNGNNTWQIYMSGSTMRVGTSVFDEGAGTLVANQWSHIVLCRQSGTLRAFIDGSETMTRTDTSSYDSTSDFVIGANDVSAGGLNHFGGYVDELRITKGVARYTAAFTPPIAPFPNQ